MYVETKYLIVIYAEAFMIMFLRIRKEGLSSSHNIYLMLILGLPERVILTFIGHKTKDTCVDDKKAI